MRDSLVFYRSFYEALKCLPEDEYNKATKYIFEYALNEQEPADKQGMAYAVFILIKPQIDANNKRFENGTKGGRPKTKIKPNENQSETKSKANVNVNENVNDNVNVNVNEKGIQGENILGYVPVAPSKRDISALTREILLGNAL